jgi:hypothetical protein
MTPTQSPVVSTPSSESLETADREWIQIGSRPGEGRTRTTRKTLRVPLLVLGFAVFGTFVVWSIGFVPPNMDEFNHPHRLACLYPNAHLNTERAFVIGCDSYLIDYGVFSYHRGFQYIGLTSSILYYPLWRVWRSPYSYFAKGLLFLLAFTWLLVRALNLERKHALIVLCYFPIAYSFIHDTGPLRLSLLSYPLIVLMIVRMLDEARMSYKLALAVGSALLISLCVEDKPFYVFVLPSLAVFVAGCRVLVRPQRSLLADMRENWLPLLVFSLASGVGIGFLLFLGTTEGQVYFEYLRNAPENSYRFIVQSAFIGAFTFSWARFTHRVFEVPLTWQVAASVGTLLLGAWTMLMAWKSGSSNRRALWFFGAAYLLGVLVFLLVRTPWAGHHYIFLHIPLLGLLLWVAREDAIRYRFALGGTLTLAVIAMALSSASEIDPKSVHERSRIFSYLRQPDVASEHIINFSSFGGYYHQALFGHDDQLVTWSHSGRRNREPAIELQRLAGLTSRNILNICRDCDDELMRSFYATDRITEIDLGLRFWKVFRITPDS